MLTPTYPGFFDVETRTAKLTAMGDPLVKLNAQINREAFRPDLARVHAKERKNNAGAKPIDVVLMFKMLVLQHLYNLADEGNELPRGKPRGIRTAPVDDPRVSLCIPYLDHLHTS
ncbi:transposase [Candidatus Nitrotoga sp. AM1P]|uniref:transposase n=1 Tax=Candidatus Nitrotoga sp. AM1P TaxID=2559597 RepID=UPI0010B09CAF|nr:transposase [Candidatus Nitrotoga sp. AM1P]BBJ22265.1 hypothetical protein W01_01920 [Candidatus Nitrotoga sp. AM1P]